jgi:endonuclease-3 related protein
VLGVEALFSRLFAAYGPQHWWPARTPFEVIVGAILVQRTTWPNAARALERLRRKGLINPVALAVAEHGVVAELIRPAGFYRTKAANLLGVAAHVERSGGLDALQTLPDRALRREFLQLRGIGAETADAILLYAFGRPAWVVDAYSRRLFARLFGRSWDETVEREYVGALIGAKEVESLNELHALIVEHGKRYCRAKPMCEDCVLRFECAFVS